MSLGIRLPYNLSAISIEKCTGKYLDRNVNALKSLVLCLIAPGVLANNMVDSFLCFQTSFIYSVFSLDSFGFLESV